ncbi:MAG: sialidase family protein [Gemmataceae bacterium]
MRLASALLVAALAAASPAGPDAAPADGVVRTVVRTRGADGVHTYRIPGLAVTNAGTLVAVFDARHAGAGDLPADIDVGVMRSTDGGRTWGRMAFCLDFDKAEKDARGNGVGDPAVVVDRKTGDVIVAGLWSKGNRGWNGSGPGLSPEETGQLVLTRSKDDGKTWSPPVNVTAKVAGRDPAWRLFFQGPGAGVQTRDGKLVFAAQYREAKGTPRACLLHSGDGGATWAVSPPAAPAGPPTSEAQVAEAADGSLLLTMRDESRSGKRLWARFNPKSGEWGRPWSELADPTCQASIVAHPSGALVFTNPASAKERKGLTVRVSDDGGATWSAGRVVDARPSAYSCLAVLKDGSLGVLYECGDRSAYETLAFARFSLDWARGR